MFWDDQYSKRERLWGEQPSELAVAAVEYLKKYRTNDRVLDILDIGCGYGRDAFHFLNNIKCSVLGIDLSEKAIDIALAAIHKAGTKNLAFECRDLSELEEDNFDVINASNLYQILEPDIRAELRKAISRTLKPGGLLFLSTLSIKDPEHYGKGVKIPKESNSFKEEVYIHLCTRDELHQDFRFLDIRELYEHEYYEPRATGETHHHISWILIGERPASRS